MKKTLIIMALACVAMAATAQPAARRQQQQQQQKKSNADNMTTRAQISFPVASTMPENVGWRRDIYRELDLNVKENSPLYYPKEPIGNQGNLFFCIFRLMSRGQVSVYEYSPVSDTESFLEKDKVKLRTILDNYHIFYEQRDKGIYIDPSDIPCAEVKSYYIKESTYYDEDNAAFHTQVVALCPVLSREDDFGDGVNKYPLFWVKYEDLAPFLAKQVIMTSDMNNAATMSIDDYFTENHYKGTIYKTNNMLGQTLAQKANGSDSVMTAEQKKIEEELQAFEKTVWGDPAKKDSLDSIANAQADVRVKKKRTVRTNRRAGTATEGDATEAEQKPAAKEQKAAREPKVRQKRTTTRSSSVSSGSARVSVRRQRH